MSTAAVFVGTGRQQATGVLRHYLRPRRRQVFLLVATLVLSVGTAVVAPQLLRRFIDSASGGETLPALLRLGGAYLLAALVAELVWIASEFVGARLAWDATNQLRGDLSAHCLDLDMSFYEENPPGELIERVDGDVGKLAGFLSDMFVLLASNLLLLFGIGVALFVENWRLGLCYLPFVIGSGFLLRRLVGVALPANVEQRKAVATQLGYIEEQFSGLPDIRANGAGAAVLRGFWLNAAGLLTASRRAARLGVRWPAAAQALSSVGLLLALVAGAVLYLDGSMTLGAVYALVAYAGMLQMPLLGVVFQMRAFEEAVGALRRIAALFGERRTVPDGPDEFARGGGAVSVELDEVSYCYRPGEWALRDVSMRVPAGRRLAVIGRTGSGKSTLARLLFRMADPTGGRVLVDGRDLRTVTVASVRAHIGFITQEVRVFNASVRENVSLFGETVGDDDIVRAVREVGLGDWLDRLPDGLDTDLGPGGTGLSAGEAQLLAFARVLLADPALVVLDEATSRLDPASRRQVDQALRRLLAGRTAVIVAHQRDMLRHADQVLVVADGRVVGHGPPDVLADDLDSHFRQLTATGETTP